MLASEGKMRSNYPTTGEIKAKESVSKEELMDKIKGTFKHLGNPLSEENCCIYRVPMKLRKINEAAYTPQLVSIGPFHHGKKKLKKMEKHKVRYLHKFLSRSGSDSSNLEMFVSAIKNSEDLIRACYAESFDHLNSDKFIEMILLDVAFIIELFVRCHCPTFREKNDFILFKPWLIIDIWEDLMLLENQIPFFVLEELYNLAFASHQSPLPSFLELAHDFFNNYLMQDKDLERKPLHFTDFLRSMHLPAVSSPNRELANRSVDHLYSASELCEAGVKFKVSPSKCLLDMKFINKELEIPCLKLYDNTESFIRNLMALEQCHYPTEISICHYILFLVYLINTAKDVGFLVRKKIIVNGLGDHEVVATLVNKLCLNIVGVKASCYTSVCRDLNKYYEDPFHKWRALLRHEYFKNSWRGASVVAAFILLMLTLVQTVCSFISLFHHS